MTTIALTLSDQHAESMQKCLQTEIEYLEQFNSVLDAERDAVEHNDSSALTVARMQKETVLQQLSQASQQHQSILQQCQLPHDATGLAAFIDASPDIKQSGLTLLREKYKNQLQICRDKNLSNGMLMNMRLHNMRRLLQILGGKDASEANTYGEDGKL